MQLPSRYIRRVLRAVAAGLPISVLGACDRPAPPAGQKDTVVSVVPPPDTLVVAAPVASTWDSTAGPALFVVGASPSDAFVIIPGYIDSVAFDSVRFDFAPLRAMQLELFSSGKRLAAARISAVTRGARTDSCRAWPAAKLEGLPSDTSAHLWSVGFETGHAVAVALDSIEALPSADSARLAADIARISSALPGDTSAAFRGLPFVVNKAWRWQTQGGQTIAAVVVRNVNQEANPRQERILLIAERDTATTARYTPQFWERIAGLEETVETTDLVANLLLGTERRPTLVVARDTGNGTSYALVERIAGRWQRKWASAYAGC